MLLVEALDSHIYWQLSEPQYRNSGEVYDKGGPEGNTKGSDDPQVQGEIEVARALTDRLEAMRRR